MLTFGAEICHTLEDVVGFELRVNFFDILGLTLGVLGTEPPNLIVDWFIHLELEEGIRDQVHKDCSVISVKPKVEGKLATFSNGVFCAPGNQNMVNCG